MTLIVSSETLLFPSTLIFSTFAFKTKDEKRKITIANIKIFNLSNIINFAFILTILFLTFIATHLLANAVYH